MNSNIRHAMLKVISDLGPDNIQSGTVVQQTIRQVGARSRDEQQAVLTVWHDLLRTGQLAWGYDGANVNPPFAHLTEHGRRTLEHLSRDPSNPDGYLASLRGIVAEGSVAESYVHEALATYNTGCHKACAVMIGAAAESLVLELRDELAARLGALGKPVSKDLHDRQIKRVLDAIEAECVPRAKTMPKGLGERISASWSSFSGHIRIARNDAGHPKTIEPVTLDVVHGSLLIFPEFAKLVANLRAWVQSTAFL